MEQVISQSLPFGSLPWLENSQYIMSTRWVLNCKVKLSQVGYTLIFLSVTSISIVSCLAYCGLAPRNSLLMIGEVF